MKNINSIFNKIPKIIKNKYIITSLFFVIWIIFLDDYNLIKQNKIVEKVEELKKQKRFYKSETYKDSIKLIKLKTDSSTQEKFAREKFLMKKDNEDLFIIRRNLK